MEEQQSARDTQFLGFASLLRTEILKMENNDFGQFDSKDYRQLIAQRAYDFAKYAVSCVSDYADKLMPDIPDLTEWPEQEAAVNSADLGINASEAIAGLSEALVGRNPFNT